MIQHSLSIITNAKSLVRAQRTYVIAASLLVTAIALTIATLHRPAAVNLQPAAKHQKQTVSASTTQTTDSPTDTPTKSMTSSSTTSPSPTATQTNTPTTPQSSPTSPVTPPAPVVPHVTLHPENITTLSDNGRQDVLIPYTITNRGTLTYAPDCTILGTPLLDQHIWCNGQTRGDFIQVQYDNVAASSHYTVKVTVQMDGIDYTATCGLDI